MEVQWGLHAQVWGIQRNPRPGYGAAGVSQSQEWGFVFLYQGTWVQGSSLSRNLFQGVPVPKSGDSGGCQ